MSQQQEKLGGGLLLRNFRKQSDKHPDFTGNEIQFCCPRCKAEFQIACAAWEKSGKRGKFFSLSISTPYVRPSDPFAPPADAPQGESANQPESSESRRSDDDVPF